MYIILQSHFSATILSDCSCLPRHFVLPGVTGAISWKSWLCSLLDNFLCAVACVFDVQLYWMSVNSHVQSKNCVSEEMWIRCSGPCWAGCPGRAVGDTPVPVSAPQCVPQIQPCSFRIVKWCWYCFRSHCLWTLLGSYWFINLTF